MPDARDRAKLLTRWGLILTLVAWLAYDLAVWLLWRGHATVSTVVGEWFALAAWGWVWVGTFGWVAGHLVGMMPLDTPAFWWRAFAFLLSCVAGFVVTWRVG